MIKKGMLVFGICWFVIFMELPAFAFRLPDTGQHKCYDNDGNEITCPSAGQPLHGQDAQHKGPEPSFRDNGDGTVTDLNTGLTWQQGDTHNYSTRTWLEACDYCSKLTLDSKVDWRMPTKRELVSIVNYGVFNPSINTNYFDCRSSRYWSGDTNAYYPSNAWYVNFDEGFADFSDKTNDYLVRCVRGVSSAHAGFVNTGSDMITDKVTGLVWQKRDDQNDSGRRTWEDALDYCECLDLGGHTDWRLPNVRELESLSDATLYHPAIDPLFDCRTSGYWSSSSEDMAGSSAWYVHFDHGYVDNDTKTWTNYVRCVRGGPSVSLTTPVLNLLLLGN